MFAKGNRFPAQKPSEVPGPNAYDLQDPEFDAYKRGAFLEKDDRFKHKDSDVPGPSHNPDVKRSVRQVSVSKGSNNGYAILQKKLEDLERVHAESKRAYEADSSRLKEELLCAQKRCADVNESVDKLRKHSDAQDAKLADLKKITLGDQAEIKDLRAKLRVSEHERTQLTSNQGEAHETKKALHALDARRRDEGREKDRKIAELEKALTLETNRRESAEASLADSKSASAAELQQAKSALLGLSQELKEANANLATLAEQAEDTEAHLLSQLEDHKLMLSRVATEYGRLASSTVSKLEHGRVKNQSLTLQLQLNRVERKSANAEDQVAHLAELIRHMEGQNALLSAQLRQSERDLKAYSSALRLPAMGQKEEEHPILSQLYNIGRELRDSECTARAALRIDDALWNDLHTLRSQLLLLHSDLLVKHVQEAQAEAEQRRKELNTTERKLSALTQELSNVRVEQESAKGQLIEVTSALAVAHASEELLKKQLESIKSEKKAEVAKLQTVVKQEKDGNQRLVGVVQQGKLSEAALNSELNRVTAELAEAEQYREAYCNMVDEVDALVRRNALAEDEARTLSKFNAQILGHKNPAQRIMYVDKIRQELHETKQQLLMTTRDKEAVINENDELHHELAMYKSVGVPRERLHVTRVSRAPFASRNLNVTSAGQAKVTSLKIPDDAERSNSPTLGFRPGDMTLDEIA